MTTQIEINPNLRIGDGRTIADLDEDVYGPPLKVCDDVEVFERSSGLVGRGRVTEIDEAERTVTIWVDWANLKLPQGTRGTAGHVRVVSDWTADGLPLAV